MTTVTYPSGASDDAATLLSPTGNYVTVVSDADGTFGSLTFNDDKTLSGTGTNVFLDETWQSVDVSLEGNVVNSEQFTATATNPDFSSELSLARANDISDLGLTLEDLAGSYVMSAGPNSPDGVSTTVNIATDGTVDGQDTSNCNFEGTVSIPDTSFNIFEGNLSVTLCEDIEGGATGDQRNGDYEVIGSYDPSINQVLFSGTNGTVVALFISDPTNN